MATKHYLQVTEEHFREATKVTQKTTQQAHAASGKESQSKVSAHEKTLDLPVSATSRDTLQTRGMGDAGLEPVTSAV